MKLYDYPPSGNGYKVRLALAALGISFEYVPVDILAGDTRTPEFLAKNANGRIPLLQLPDETYLAESNAILFYLAQGSDLWPKTTVDQAKALQWMFFEQYSHEPNIATARFWLSIKKIAPNDPEYVLLQSKTSLGYAALNVMENHLKSSDYFVGGKYSVADIALYAYTHVAHEGGFSLEGYPAIRQWLRHVSAEPNHVRIEEWQ
jgi:glutathione S-transferase